ncbi:MAG: hypothetical protein JXQ72_17020, partial [Anaerolineae bacterium]|nr:hypothetical protein [Anaerolineae bacterium]
MINLPQLYKNFQGQTTIRFADIPLLGESIGVFFDTLTSGAALIVANVAVELTGPASKPESIAVTGETGSFGPDAPAVITVTFQQEEREQTISVSVDFEAQAAPSIAAFFRLIGGIDLSTYLPSPFNAFSDLGLRHVDTTYNVPDNRIESVGLTIQTSRSWDLLPKLTVENIELSAALDNPGDRNERTVTLGIEGDCSIGGSDANTIHVSATTSPYEARAELAEGEIALGDAVTLFMDASIDLGAALTKFDLSVQPAEHAYSVKADIAADQWELVFTEDIRFGLRKLAFEVARKNGNVTGGIEGKMHIGPADGGINLEVSAMHPEPDSGWIFAASMKEKETVPLGDLAGEFLQEIGGGDSVAEWIPQLDISDVSFKAALPPGDQSEKGNTYTVQGAVAWAFEYEGISFPSLRAEVLMSYNKAGTSGHIKGMAEFLGLEMALGYEFSPTDRSLFIEWEGFRGTYAKQDGQKTITFVMGDRSLGALIVALMRSIDADFRLSAPWNVLNDINLNGLSLVYKTSDDPQTSGEIAITYEHEIDLGFLTFTSLKLTKTKQAGVVLAAEGTFLGLKIGSDEDYSGLDKGRNVTDLPTVPGAGDALFQLKYLGLGQHVSLYPPQGLPNVDAATKSLLHVFKDPPPPEPGQPPLLPVPIPPAQAPPVSEAILIFNRNSHWLIGTQFVILQAITVSAIFNDPDLYGLLIEVGGDKFPTFKGLSFEILYKKITDSIGVFHLELQLPDAMRQLEFGAVSVTLPIVAVDIYTNGNFKLDFGFPYNMDFSRSMTVQAFPFTGSGGFYFAYLNSATSTRVPVTTRGRFDPVIEFGLGLQLGIGKDISKGIFKAGLSLTLIGIVEGVFGQYHPYPGNPGQDEVYYWLQGTLGLIGHIYGEVNFSIISARVDITVYAYAQITIECYRAIPIYLEAAVKVSLKVKINLGLFKITISLKFGITVTASFTIGSDSVAPWDELGQPASFALPASVSAPLTWPPVLVPDAQKETLTTYFLPHLTLSGEGDFPGARYVAMLYMDSPEGGQSPDNPISFERLANAVLVWVLNAVIHPTQDSATLDDVLNAPVSLDALRSLYAAFDQPAPPFTYEDITAFLRGYFKAINITGPDAARAAGITDLHATVFPMIPDLWLKTTLNGTLRDEVDFAAGANVTGDYRGKLRGLFAHMAVDYHRDVVQESGPHDHQGTESRSISMATAVFEDFFALIAKNAIQDAIDDFENYDQPVTVGTLLQAANGTEHAARIAGMSARYLLHGLRLPDPAHMATHRPLYDLTGQQVVVPSLKAGDQFSFTLTHAPDWIIFNGAALDPAKPDTARLAVMLDKAAISRANALTSIPFSPRLERGTPQPLPAGRLVERLFTLKSDIAWQYPDEQDSAPRTIWQLSPALLHVLQNAPPDEVPALTLHAATQSRPDAPVQHTTLERYDWATLVHVALRKIPPADNTPILAHTYEVIGADETSIVYLERLLRYLYAHGDREINQIRLLYRPAITGDSPQGLRSEQDFAYVMALVKGNLSTETNPPKAGVFALAMAPGEPAYNTLNTPQDFVTLLWQCSIVRSGGFYLYYHVHDGGGSLPDHLFADDGTGSISILVTYTRDGVGDFLNSVAVAEPTRDATLYARSDTLTSLVATVPPGHVGIAVERAYPGEYQPVEPYPAAPTAASQEQERRYLEHQFNLMGYKLEDSTAITAQDRALLPVGAVDDVPREDIAGLEAVPPDSDGSWSYRVVLPVARYARTFTPSRHEDILPARDNPYAGVGGSAALRLFWQDLFGNTADTALSNDTPIYYTDPLIGLSRWPGVTSEYTFATDSGSRQIHITLSFDTGRYENNGHNAQLDAITYRRTYYQLLQDDVQVSFRTTLDGSANAPGAAIPVDKTRLLDFVARIYRYLTDGTPLGQDQNLLVLTASITRHNSAHIFELAVDFTIKRTDHIAHEFAPPEADENTGEVSEVAAAITAIRPATRA